MRDSSIRGVEVLRILALSIRSDQDYGLTGDSVSYVGALLSDVAESGLADWIKNYRPPYSSIPGFAPLTLRQALNKIAHANPGKSGFFADATTHDLILAGEDRRKWWIAVISLIDLCAAVNALPDGSTRQ